MILCILGIPGLGSAEPEIRPAKRPHYITTLITGGLSLG